MLSLGWARGLRNYQLIALLGWPLLPRGNSASKLRDLEVLSLQDSLQATPTKEYHRWRHCKFYTLWAISYRHTYKSQKFFFWFTSDVFCKRPVSAYQDSYVKFLQGDLQAKVVTEMDYLSRFWRSHAWVPQTSLQADFASTHHQEQKPQDPRRTRWLQEKGRGAISPDSRVSHPLHYYAVRYYSRSKYDVPWDWLWEACHVAKGLLRNLLQRIL